MYTYRPSGSDNPPRILGVGFYRLQNLLRELAPSFSSTALVEVLDLGFEEAVAQIHNLRKTKPIDVLVAAGSNGEFLRQHIDLPVVLVKVGGFDVMRALARARNISNRIALVTYGGISPEVYQFNELFGLEIEQRTYQSEQEARDCVAYLKAKGIDVVVAPGLVANLAEGTGMTSVFLYSHDAVRSAIDDAIEVARAARIMSAKGDRLNNIIGQLRDGVLAVDADERIEAINPAMEQLLNARRTQVLGHRLSDLFPTLSLERTLSTTQKEVEEIEQFGQRKLIASRLPIFERGILTGAVLICQNPSSIQRVDRRLRAASKQSNTTARYRFSDIVGKSSDILRAKMLAEQFSHSDATVLIVGESGTGKELFAQSIHSQSARADHPFIVANCAAFSESLLESELFGYEEGAFTGARKNGKLGLFEAAHTGSIFLDEIGEMPIPLQTRLLRVLQEREILRVGGIEPTPINVRVIAATHRNLAELVSRGEFRRDLYYRLNILHLQVPNLRSRCDDLFELVEFILKKNSMIEQSDSHQVERLIKQLLRNSRSYSWPGNVRELQNMIERIVCYCQRNTSTEVPHRLDELIPELGGVGGELNSEWSLPKKNDLETTTVRRVLEECHGNRQAACERLQISRTTLWRKLKMEKRP